MGEGIGAVVFVFDPVVEVDVELPVGGKGDARVHYRDPGSMSAALASVAARGAALESACQRHDIERGERLERAAPLERMLRARADAEERGLVRRAAWLALVQGQCTDAPANRTIAKRLLDVLRPDVPEIGPWTDALRRLGATAGEPTRADALVDAVIEQHPEPAVGARLLFLRLIDLGTKGDPRERALLERRLTSPRFLNTVSASLAKKRFARRDSVALSAGDPWPAIALEAVDGEMIETATPGVVRLVYFGASWCWGCFESLPEVRRLADIHPELSLVYVLWDGPRDARDFVERNGPVPGDVAWTDEPTRELVRARVMNYVRLPSFVLIDADGTVVTTSDETTLSELEPRLTKASGA